MTVRILYVDEGATFGGSIVVAGLLVRHLDPTSFSASVAIPFEDEFTARVFRGPERIHLRRSLLPYNRMSAYREKIDARLPSGVRQVAHAVLSGLDVLAGAVYCFSLATLIVRDRVQVVHVNNSIEAVAAGCLTRRPVVVHLHGCLPEKLPTTHKWLYRRCSAIIAISDCVRRSAEGAGLPHSVMQVIPNGTQLSKVRPDTRSVLRRKWHIPASSPLIALVGRVVAWKGHREFLEAAVHVRRRHPDAHFMFVGGVSDGRPEFLDELMDVARSSGLEGVVHCTGYVADVPAYMEAADVVVHASVAPEPFGLVIIEAMAMSRPVIASLLGAGPEIVTHGHDGLLVDPRKAQDLSDAICRLIEDRGYARSLAIAARRTVEERFTAEAMTGAFERVYRRVSCRGSVAIGGKS